MGILASLSLFSGIGGIELAGKLSGGVRTVCWVEKDPYAQAVLMSRMRSGELDLAPIWDDVSTFDGNPWAGKVDVVAGGFPCQDLSVAGRKAGIHGARSGLWFEFARIIGEVRPRFVFVENVPGLISSGGMAEVLRSLAEAGYDAEWECLSANDVGAPHLRERIWIVAYANSGGFSQSKFFSKQPWRAEALSPGKNIPYRKTTNRQGDAVCDSERWGCGRESWGRTRAHLTDRRWWSAEPNVGRVAHGIPFRVDRLRGLGNSVVPQCAQVAWEKILKTAFGSEFKKGGGGSCGKSCS